jgi:hypothetical protein
MPLWRTSENFPSRNCLIIPEEPRFGVLGETQQGLNRRFGSVRTTQGSPLGVPKRFIRQFL